MSAQRIYDTRLSFYSFTRFITYCKISSRSASSKSLTVSQSWSNSTSTGSTNACSRAAVPSRPFSSLDLLRAGFSEGDAGDVFVDEDDVLCGIVVDMTEVRPAPAFSLLTPPAAGRSEVWGGMTVRTPGIGNTHIPSRNRLCRSRSSSIRRKVSPREKFVKDEGCGRFFPLGVVVLLGPSLAMVGLCNNNHADARSDQLCSYSSSERELLTQFCVIRAVLRVDHRRLQVSFVCSGTTRQSIPSRRRAESVSCVSLLQPQIRPSSPAWCCEGSRYLPCFQAPPG